MPESSGLINDPHRKIAEYKQKIEVRIEFPGR